jgi:hypothetical protein
MIENDQIRLAFSRVKQDILSLNNEISNLKQGFSLLKEAINEISLLRNEIKELKEQINDCKYPAILQVEDSTSRQINKTVTANSTDISTVPQEIGGFKYPNLMSSTGNEGVSTNRQTDIPTDELSLNNPILPDLTDPVNFNNSSIESNIQEASDILDSLDRLKKEVRRKFRRLTPQEMNVFSTIYQLEEQNPMDSNYKVIASKLHLSESSIRDYVQRMTNKGIPIKKHKIDNKKVILSISSELKRIATLPTIYKLREL